MKFEKRYNKLLRRVLGKGIFTHSRNGKTYNLLNQTLEFDNFPHLNARKLYYKGVVGELIGFMRGAQNVKSFKDLGCNYWDDFAEKRTGKLPIQYGFKWFNYHGVNQFAELIENLRKDKGTSRQHMLLTLDPTDKFRLYPCHFAYQFYVLQGKLHIIWYQRSADLVLGVPSDAILAHLLLQIVSMETNIPFGSVHMNFGICHIYQNHVDELKRYLTNVPVAEKLANYYISYTSNNALYEPGTYKTMGLENFVHSGTPTSEHTYYFPLNV